MYYNWYQYRHQLLAIHSLPVQLPTRYLAAKQRLCNITFQLDVLYTSVKSWQVVV